MRLFNKQRLLSFFAKVLLIISSFFAIGHVMASCTTAKQYSVQIPLQAGTFSAGAEFPVGSNIRVQYIRGYTEATSSCTKSNPYVRMSLSGGTLYPGQTNIYQTGVSGVGVRFRNPYENKYYPFNTTYNLGQLIPGGWLDFTIELVKVGPITAGRINTALFPQVRIDAMDADNIPARFAYHTITGSFTIQTPTCTTPNFSWDLGTTSTTILKKKGDTSLWKDTPVTLTGCSAFLGNNSNGSFTRYAITGTNTGTVSQSGNVAANNLIMSLSPSNPSIDQTKGILGLDKSSTASGFGVQIASKQAGIFEPKNLTSSITISPAVGYSGGSVSFPLGARIIRTGDIVQPGKISTSLTYTINYQ